MVRRMWMIRRCWRDGVREPAEGWWSRAMRVIGIRAKLDALKGLVDVDEIREAGEGW